MDSAPRRSLAPTIALLSGVRLVLNIAHRFVYPFLPAIARGAGITLEQAGFVVSLRWLAGLGTPGVVVALRGAGGRRRLMALGLGLFAAGAAVTAFTGVLGGLIVGFVLMGLAKPVYDIAAQAYIADRVPYARRGRALAVMELTWAGALLVGAPAAGWAIATWGWASPFWVLAALAVVGLGAVVRTIEDDDAAGREHRSLRLDAMAIGHLAAVALFTLAAEVMFVVFGAWMEDSFGLSLVALGGAAAIIGGAELAGEGATVAFTDRLGKRRSVALGLGLSIAGFLLLIPGADTLWLGLTAIALALAGFEFTIVSNVPLATEIRPRARARYLSVMIVATAIGRTVGTAAGPLLFDRFGVAGNAVVAAVADAAALVVLLASVRESGLQRMTVEGVGDART